MQLPAAAAALPEAAEAASVPCEPLAHGTARREPALFPRRLPRLRSAIPVGLAFSAALRLWYSLAHPESGSTQPIPTVELTFLWIWMPFPTGMVKQMLVPSPSLPRRVRLQQLVAATL